jgi:oxaloacetate decarboxylase (Na+ extruding) subunit alpha
MDHVQFIDTTLRDAQASLWATGMRTDMILPVARNFDRAGLEAIEIIAAGGFEKKMVRELGEDPFERIRLVRERVESTPLRVIRTRSLAAFQMAPKCIEDLWWKRIAAHGIRQARLADPSNTPANWRRLVTAARGVGIEPLVNLTFTVSPKHTDEYYAGKAKEAAKLDVIRICLKDPGGLLTPERTRTLVPIIQQRIKGIPVEFHTHCTTGLGAACTLEAIKLGIKYVNTAIPPLAEASSNPSIFNVARNARALGYTFALNEAELRIIERHFRKIAEAENLPVGAPVEYDYYQYIHQVPGGMISNLRHQLAMARLSDKLDDVLREVSTIRSEFGYPIMVTPYSQFLGVQAVMNVVAGERYKVVSDEIIHYALGYYGDEERSSIDPKVREIVLSRPRAKELERDKSQEPSLEEMQQQLGGGQMSDDELLLRYFAGPEAVKAMRSGAVVKKHTNRLRDLEGVRAVIDQIGKPSAPNYVRVESKAGLSVVLSRSQ